MMQLRPCVPQLRPVLNSAKNAHMPFLHPVAPYVNIFYNNSTIIKTRKFILKQRLLTNGQVHFSEWVCPVPGPHAESHCIESSGLLSLSGL